MALLNDILKWTETLPHWQRDAARRLLQNEDGLSETDYAELYTLLKAAHGLPNEEKMAPEPLAENHLPAEFKPGEKIILKAMRQLQNVNRLPSGQVLKFAEAGLTVIYGGNGSGKSGYGRALKQACRARGQIDQVLPDAHDPAAISSVPSAEFDVRVAGVDNSVSWKGDQDSPDELSTISVFDSGCARAYLTTEQDVAYLPYGLDIVEKLANEVLPKLSEILDTEINSIPVDESPFEHLHGDTAVGKQIQGLTTKTKASEIETLAVFGDEDEKRLTELNAALAEADPIAKAAELNLSVGRLKELADAVIKPLVLINGDAIAKLKKLDQESVNATAAEKGAAEALQSGDNLLKGTGGVVWKALFEAARKFSNDVASPDCDFPHTSQGAPCPLCQESLPAEASDRLIRFEQYIKDDIGKTAEESRKKLNQARTKIVNASLEIGLSAPIKAEISSLDESLVPALEAFETSIDEVRTSMLAALETHDWDSVEKLADNPRGAVRKLASQQLLEARTLLRAADEEKKKALVAERAELVAKKDLFKSLKPVLALLERMKQKEALEKCKKDLKTFPISKKSKELASSAVTGELSAALNSEFSALGIGHIKTKLKERTQKGRMYHQLILDLPTAHDLDKILSEGEQRAIAIGSFLAELQLANHTCGIVFDDPVSSLDHWRRKNVARRLVAESKVRQVVVFTHDTSFLGQLCDEIEDEGVPNKRMFLEHKGDVPGAVISGLPWDHKGYKERINDLEQGHSKIAKTWPAYPNEQDITQMRHQYDRLRATIERVVQDVVFGGVVKRYRDWIRMDKLAEVVGFENSEYSVIEKLHKRCCDVVTAHDPSSAKAATVPSPTELKADIESLEQVVDDIKTRRAAAKKTA